MSREGIETQLLAHGVQVYEPIYSETQVTVYRADYRGDLSAVKILYLPPSADQTQMEREFRALQTLKHPCIINLLDCFWANNLNQYYFVLVLEWCEVDLDKDLILRQKTSWNWTEPELWKITKDLIGAFSFMQEQGYAHRDIKPSNLFLSGNQIKIGDFGSSKYLVGSELMVTLTGSPLFLSPVLKESFLQRLGKVQHNVYKSDVYSLGMTLLSLARLDSPFSLFATKFTNEAVLQILCPLHYSDCFKLMLQGMLLQDEEVRCDFIQMNKWVNRVLEPVEMPRADKMDSDSIAFQMKEEHKEEAPPASIEAGKNCDHCENPSAKTVQLTCNQHVLCQDCLRSLIDQMQSEARCPVCKVQLDAEIIQTYQVARSIFSRAFMSVVRAVKAIIPRSSNEGPVVT